MAVCTRRRGETKEMEPRTGEKNTQRAVTERETVNKRRENREKRQRRNMAEVGRSFEKKSVCVCLSGKEGRGGEEVRCAGLISESF